MVEVAAGAHENQVGRLGEATDRPAVHGSTWITLPPVLNLQARVEHWRDRDGAARCRNAVGGGAEGGHHHDMPRTMSVDTLMWPLTHAPPIYRLAVTTGQFRSAAVQYFRSPGVGGGAPRLRSSFTVSDAPAAGFRTPRTHSPYR